MRSRWQLRRNCCLTPLQLAIGLALPCCVALAIALWFAWQGAWPVLAFAVLQAIVCAALFVCLGRHVGDHETITLRDSYLQIDLVEGAQCRRTILNPHWVRITPPGPRHALIRIEAMGRSVSVGRFLPVQERLRIAQELQQALGRH
jgi:uncharacterized membrane protein